MRLHKVINRVLEGTVYYRWVLSISPKNVRELGWVDGQELEAVVSGSRLWIQPSVRVRARLGRRQRPAGAMEEGVHRKSLARP
jgi:hypothetical protein